eukprot:2381468-Amphidinium_carterae.1
MAILTIKTITRIIGINSISSTVSRVTSIAIFTITTIAAVAIIPISTIITIVTNITPTITASITMITITTMHLTEALSAGSGDHPDTVFVTTARPKLEASEQHKINSLDAKVVKTRLKWSDDFCKHPLSTPRAVNRLKPRNGDERHSITTKCIEDQCFVNAIF